ncbi:MAG: energy transducer TonB [Rhodospirillaceae bacterium]|nr:energy transducer TonB [Rhodospirillaceae bacterium]
MPPPTEAPVSEIPVAPEPVPEVEAVETVDAVEVIETPQPRLAAVQPPARPERNAPQHTKKAASPPTSSPPTAPAPAPTPQTAALPGGKAGPVGPADTGLFEKAATFPDYLANPAPAYPRSELRRGREGLVLLRVRVTPKGRPSEISVSRSSGIAAFDQAAVRAVRAWRFLPATRGGQPIAGTVKVPIRFALNRS